MILSYQISFFFNRTYIIMKIYIIWLVGVILWNFGYPTAAPILDVIAAIVLSFMSMGMKKYLKL